MMEQDLNAFRQSLKSGGIIVLRTDEIIGLICDPSNNKSVAELKSIGEAFGMYGCIQILVEADSRLNKLVPDLPDVAWDIIDTGEPAILELKDAKGLAENALTETGEVRIRMVRSQNLKSLLSRSPAPTGFLPFCERANTKVSIENSAAILNRLEYILPLAAAKEDRLDAILPIIFIAEGGLVKIIRS